MCTQKFFLLCYCCSKTSRLTHILSLTLFRFVYDVCVSEFVWTHFTLLVFFY